jgi:uncharacterized protein (TIGR03435 family)
MTNSTLARVMIAALAACALFAQSPTSPPAFEVATVKPSSPATKTMGVYTFPGGRVTAERRDLVQLTEVAFSLEDYQIAGGPGWVRDREVEYDIDARPPASSKSSKSSPSNPKLDPNDEQRQMLQTLLVDRFQLKYHVETKEGAVYRLTRGKRELKLQSAKDREAFPWAGSARGGPFGSDGIAGTNISMAQLATRLSKPLGRPVLDQTGIEGVFDFRYEYVSDDPNSDVIASLITSIQSLGLKLESARGPVEYLVIDHAEKPSAN